MSSIEEQIKHERRVTNLLRAAIDLQLEFEKAMEKLIKNMYKDLKGMKADGYSSEDWTTMFDTAQQLVDTFTMLTVDESPMSTIEESKFVFGVEKEVMNGEESEEDIEEYLEALLKEIHPNLDQIRAAASLEKEELRDIFGLSKQMAKPHKFAFDGEIKTTTIEKKEDDRLNRKKMKKMKKKKKKGKRRYDTNGGVSCLSAKD